MKTLHYAVLATTCLLLGGDPAWSETAPATPEPVPSEATAAPTPATAPAPSPDPEEAVVTRLRVRVAVAEQVELDVAGKKILALQRAETHGQAQGALILLHDVGGHADWETVIGTLRRELPEFGWTTLSVQLPPPTAEMQATNHGSLLEPCQQRTAAALGHLKAQGLSNIVLLGHGLGALCATSFVGTQKDPALRGLILVGMEGYGALQPPLDSQALLAQVTVPIYDIYGYGDSAEVRSAGAERLVLGRRLNRQRAGDAAADRAKPFYRQFVQDGADHFFTEQQSLLVRRVYGWLKTHASGMELVNK